MQVELNDEHSIALIARRYINYNNETNKVCMMILVLQLNGASQLC